MSVISFPFKKNGPAPVTGSPSLRLVLQAAARSRRLSAWPLFRVWNTTGLQHASLFFLIRHCCRLIVLYPQLLSGSVSWSIWSRIILLKPDIVSIPGYRGKTDVQKEKMRFSGDIEIVIVLDLLLCEAAVIEGHVPDISV
jgi:hypothetical protein